MTNITCECCVQPAQCRITWGLYKEGGTIIYSDKARAIVLRIEDQQSRKGPMNEANLCSGCSMHLWLSCQSSVNNGDTHWVCKPVVKDS